jgi:hypothetical protein
MNQTQCKINTLARALRLQVINYLVKEDIFKYRGENLNDDDMAMTVQLIDRLPCCTRKLPELFRDAHRMHCEKGMMPHSVTVGDLEWCMEFRFIGYKCEQNVKYSWLPAPEETMLRRLPAFVQLDKIYKSTKKAIPPMASKHDVVSEANAIINELAISLTGN